MIILLLKEKKHFLDINFCLEKKNFGLLVKN